MNEFHGSATTHVTASADEVFAFITDLDRLPEWNRAIRRVVERPAALVSAAEWVVVMHPPKVPSWKSRSHLEEIEPGTRFAYRSHTDDRNPSYAHWQWNLERTADGVEVTVSRDGYPKTRFRRRIAAPLRSRMLQREAAASLDTIRRTLEPQPTKAP